MTVVVEQIQTTETAQDLPEKAWAPWQVRAAAFSVDVLPGVAAATTLTLVSFTLPVWSAWWWVCMAVLGVVVLLILGNRLLLPTITGWSLGRALFGIAVVQRDGSATGPWWLLLRDLAHLVDTAALLLGWFWPLWDSERRTFADLLVRTEVLRVVPHERPEKVRQWTAVALLLAAVICVDAVGVGYEQVYAKAQETDRTRVEVAAQGPKLVTQMLTYDPKTLKDDFARALTLTTDKYRHALLAQQESVQKGGHAVVNEYWSTSSAILSASPTSATMLILLQGRRGDGQEIRYITASVRATFVKVNDRWLVDDLTVLAKPKPPAAGK